MSFFKKLFGRGHTKLQIVDSDLGQFNSDYIKGSDVIWIGNTKLFGKSIELLMEGNQERISQVQKKIVLSALSDEDNLKSESSIAIKEEYKNAEMDFSSLEDLLEVKAITTNDNGFELSFEQKENPFFYFNVFFENNKQTGVSIDS
ncbi:hypothetical protein [Pontimicrobium aquaticum]|uniref:DUF2262 domain-containing protein n=1 Tax=Pontimicrobium aquaticum TaxID=2565367 RepID=A0A4U0F0Y8_9FLAO|nr:hypothetical protein [Pontimicrobium aquaticum]TJY38033.1 hypothetical protein E5167_01900 [Pontimicrobium aquaticum]